MFVHGCDAELRLRAHRAVLAHKLRHTYNPRLAIILRTEIDALDRRIAMVINARNALSPPPEPAPSSGAAPAATGQPVADLTESKA